MSFSTYPIEKPQPQRGAPVSRIQDHVGPMGERDEALNRNRKECDADTMRRIVDNEVVDLLPRARFAEEDAKRLKLVLAVAELSGSDKVNEIRSSLSKLSDAARP